MTDLHLFMLINIHNDLRDLVIIIGVFVIAHSADQLVSRRRP